MFNRKTLALAGLALAVAVVSPTAALAAEGGTDRPFKVSAAGAGVSNMTNGQVSYAMAGWGTHLGLFQQTEQGQAVPTAPGEFNFSSTWNLVAANGDEMSGTCAGTGATSDGIHFQLLLNCASTSGTGRFEDASAALEVVVHVTRIWIEWPISHNQVEYVAEGTISY